MAVHSTMTSNNSRSNSPTFSASGTRSRSTSASQFGQKLKGLFKFTHTNVSTHNKSSSQHSSSTEHLPRVPTPPSSQNGNNSHSQYFVPQSHHHVNGTSTGHSSADGM